LHLFRPSLEIAESETKRRRKSRVSSFVVFDCRNANTSLFLCDSSAGVRFLCPLSSSRPSASQRVPIHISEFPSTSQRVPIHIPESSQEKDIFFPLTSSTSNHDYSSPRETTFLPTSQQRTSFWILTLVVFSCYFTRKCDELYLLIISKIQSVTLYRSLPILKETKQKRSHKLDTWDERQTWVIKTICVSHQDICLKKSQTSYART